MRVTKVKRKELSAEFQGFGKFNKFGIIKFHLKKLF